MLLKLMKFCETMGRRFSIDASLVCSHVAKRTLELNGVGLISLDGVTTMVDIDSANVTFVAAHNCTTRNTTNRDSNVVVSTCARYTVEVQQRSPATAAIAPKVAATHPGSTAGYWESNTLMYFYPPPQSNSIGYPVVCAESLAKQTITITGANILLIDALKPIITVDGVALEDTDVTVEDCIDLPNIPRLSVKECTTLVLDVSSKDVAQALPIKKRTVVVTNPSTAAGCTADKALEFRVVAKPEIASVDRAFVCRGDASSQLFVSGTNFVKLDGMVPTFSIDGAAVSVSSAGKCVDHSVVGYTLELCEEVVVVIDKNNATDITVPSLAVSNSCPASTCNECRSLDSTGLATFTAPPLIVAYFPAVCAIVDTQEFKISGANLLIVGSTKPAVHVGGEARTITSVAGCTSVGAASLNAQVCSDITLRLTDVVAGFEADTKINVTNTDGCSVESDTTVFKDTRPPRVDSWAPTTLCQNLTNQTLGLTGSFPKVADVNSIVFLSGTIAKVKEVTGCSGGAFGECTFMKVETPAGLVFGQVPINVKAACEATTIPEVQVLPTPVVDSATPAIVCETKQKDVVFAGKYMVPDVKLELNGVPWSYTTQGGCATENAVRVCKTLEFTIDASQCQLTYTKRVQHLDSRCILSPAIWRWGMLPTKTRLESIIQKVYPHVMFFYSVFWQANALVPGFVTATLDNGNDACEVHASGLLSLPVGLYAP